MTARQSVQLVASFEESLGSFPHSLPRQQASVESLEAACSPEGLPQPAVFGTSGNDEFQAKCWIFTPKKAAKRVLLPFPLVRASPDSASAHFGECACDSSPLFLLGTEC